MNEWKTREENKKETTTWKGKAAISIIDRKRANKVLIVIVVGKSNNIKRWKSLHFLHWTTNCDGNKMLILFTVDAQSIRTRPVQNAICTVSYQIMQGIHVALFPMFGWVLFCVVFCFIVVCFSSSYNSFACGQMHSDNKRANKFFHFL